MITKFNNFIVENKFWGKTITNILNWLDEKSDKFFIFIDTETTGLNTDPYEVQLTQVSAIVTRWNYEANTFEEVASFDNKIKLTDTTKQLMKIPGSKIKKVLSFNHYGQSNVAYYEEEKILTDFKEFIDEYPGAMFVIQNAIFDMKFLNTRHPNIKFNNEVLDTKDLIQLFFLPALQKLAETDESASKMIDTIGVSERDNGLISSSLSKIGPALKINMAGYHDALTDCRLAREMFKKIVDFLKENQHLDIRKYQAERIKTKIK